MTRSRPSLAHGTTRLIALQPAHLPWLREQELGEELAMRWRHHGRHPSPAEFEESLWSCLCTFLIVSGPTGEPVGIASAYDHDPSNQHVKVAAAALSAPRRGTAVMRGTLMLIDYLFLGWPLRKIYFESAGYNVEQFARSSHDALELEGRFREHVHLDGVFHDLLVYSLRRDDWHRVRPKYLRPARFGNVSNG